MQKRDGKDFKFGYYGKGREMATFRGTSKHKDSESCLK
jgi:hypothetical protein